MFPSESEVRVPSPSPSGLTQPTRAHTDAKADFGAAVGSAPLAQVAFGAALAISILEQIDHGVLLLGEHGRLLFVNRVAMRECAVHGALRLENGRLQALRQIDAEPLARALASATRGLRTLLHFGGEEDCLPLVVMPLTTLTTAEAALSDGVRSTGITLALLAKRSGTEPLNIELFAQAYALTTAERAVLKGLSRGLDPISLASTHGVKVSTVRTQIMHIREKTRTGSIRALLDVINNLPPVVCSTELRA